MEPATPPQPPAKKGMHGALKFILLTIAGAGLTTILAPCLLGAATSHMKTLKEQYAFAIYTFIGAAVLFFVLMIVAGPILKRWGIAGFLFGVSAAMASGLFIAEFMKMFDAPK